MASCTGSPAPAGAGPREEWDATVERLAGGGILDGDVALTTAGATFRAEIEDRTSRLGTRRGRRSVPRAWPLGELGGGLARALVAAGCFPEGIMAAGR